jgi:hypothetical protein
MEQLLVSPTKVATKWALINAFAIILITFAFEYLNVDTTSGAQYITYVPFIAFLLLTQVEHKKELGGYITFGRAFSAGFRYALFTGLIIAVFMYIYLAFVSPEVLEKSMAAQESAMLDRGMSSSEVDKAMEIGKSWGPIMAAFFTAVAYAIFGAVVSLIGAAIFKKERSPYDVADDQEIDPAV